MSIKRSSQRLQQLKSFQSKDEDEAESKNAGETAAKPTITKPQRYKVPRQGPRVSRLWFRYKPLDLQSHSIRVINILPAGSPRSPIQCTLRHVPLSNQHTCLSYAWGSENAEHTIYINDRSFPVRRNLWDFLHQARKSKIYSPIWVDAICIKQNDNKERNHQVARMAEIYSQATCVYVWLGCRSSDVVEQALRSIKNGPSRPEFFQFEKPYRMVEVYPISGARFVPSQSPDPVSWRSLSDMQRAMLRKVRAIMGVTYWSRLWIVQELLLARKGKILYGGTSIDWTSLRELTGHFKAIEHNKRALNSDVYLQRLRHIVRLQEERLKGKTLELVDLIQTFASNDCKNPLDHVYALLGLAADASDIIVDYEERRSGLLLRLLQSYKFESRKDLLMQILQLSGILEVPEGELRSTCLQRYPDARSDPSLVSINPNIELWRPLSWDQQMRDEYLFRIHLDTNVDIAGPRSETRTETATPSTKISRFWTRSVKTMTASELCTSCSVSFRSSGRWNKLLGRVTVPCATDFHSSIRAHIEKKDLVIGFADADNSTFAYIDGVLGSLDHYVSPSEWCHSQALLVKNWSQGDASFDRKQVAIKIITCSDPWCLIADPKIYDNLPKRLSRRLYLALEQELRASWQSADRQSLPSIQHSRLDLSSSVSSEDNLSDSDS